MSISWNRILALLGKDLSEYFILIFLFPILSIATFYLPSIFINDDYKLAIVSERSYGVDGEDFDNYVFFESKQEALQKLKEGKIHGVVDIIQKTVDMSDQKTVPSKEIQKAIGLAVGSNVLPDENNDNKNLNISSLIGSILLTISCFIAGPIIFLGEKSTRTYNAILLTPLSFNEYILSKTAICAITNVGSVILFYIVTNIKHLSIAFILYVLLASIFLSILSGIISSLFSNIDKAMLFSSPVMILLIILDFSIWLEKVSPVISIQSGLRYVMEFKRLERLSTGGLILAGIFAFFLFKSLCRKSITWNIAN